MVECTFQSEAWRSEFERQMSGEVHERLYRAARARLRMYAGRTKHVNDADVDDVVMAARCRTPETPCARLLQSDSVPDAMKERLRAVAITLDPLRLLDEIRTVQHQLAGLAAGARAHQHGAASDSEVAARHGT